MFNNLIENIVKYFHKDLKKISKEYKDELADQLTQINAIRINTMIPLLFILAIILLFVDKMFFFKLWHTVPAYKSLYIAHIVFLVAIFAYICLYLLGTRLKQVNKRYYEYLYLFYGTFILLWGDFLSINGQFIHNQISAFIITAFSVASIIIITPIKAAFIFIFSYILFLCGIIISQHDSIKLSGHIINSGFLIVISLLTSNFMYSLYTSDFINRRLAEKNALDLLALNNNLERIIEERTSELQTVNEIIIQEMKEKHQMEIEIAYSAARCLEKDKELKEIAELEQLRTAFLSNISHELKTPINVILSADQLLELKLKGMLSHDDYNKVAKNAFLIKQNCYRLIRLISNLLDITKIDSGYFELNLRNTNIIKTVEDIVLSVAEFVESKDIDLVFDTEIEEKSIACDADKIERILLNLLSNAIKYTSAGGTISVNIFIEDDKVRLSVKDTGIGIPEEFQKTIFDRFVQVDNSLTRIKEGTGIGLSLVKSIVELHQGCIYVKSKLGEGSEFIIELPVYTIQEDKNQSVHSSPHNISDKNKKVETINIEFSDIYE